MQTFQFGKDLTQFRCEVCREGLTVIRSADGTIREFIHRDEQADHEPDPIPLLETVGGTALKCDFCSEADPPWAYQTEVRTTSHTNPDGQRVTINHGEGVWLACDDCAGLVDRKAWPALAKHAARRLRQITPRLAALSINQAAAAMDSVHRQFYSARPGPRMRVVEPLEDFPEPTEPTGP